MKPVLIKKFIIAFTQVIIISFISIKVSDAEFGKLTVLLSLVSYLSGILIFGLNRHANFFQINNPFEYKNIYFFYIARILLCCSIFFTMKMFGLFEEYLVYLVVLSFSFATYREFHRYCRMKGIHNFALNTEIILLRLLPLCGLLFVFIFDVEDIISWYLTIISIGAIVVVIILFFLVYEKVNFANRDLSLEYIAGSWFYDFLALASRDLEVVFIAIVANLESAGLYYLGKKIFGILSIINDATQYLREQKLSSQIKSDSKSEYDQQRYMNVFVTLALFVLVLILTIIFVNFSNHIANYVDQNSIIFKNELPYIVIIFSIARIMESLVGPFNSQQLMHGKFSSVYLLELRVLVGKISVFAILGMVYPSAWFAAFPFIRTVVTFWQKSRSKD